MKRTWCGKSLLLLAAAALNIPSAWAQQSGSGDWKVWGGDPGVSHFSTLDQINTKNVSRLKPAWVYDSGKFGRSWEDTPLFVNGLLYVIDAGSSDVVALEPETGKQIWRHKAPEGQAPAGRSPQLPGMGSLLLPPWTMTRYDPDGVEMRGHFTRFHVGGNGAVHGGVLPLLFDHVFGMVVHAAARPIIIKRPVVQAHLPPPPPPRRQGRNRHHLGLWLRRPHR